MAFSPQSNQLIKNLLIKKTPFRCLRGPNLTSLPRLQHGLENIISEERQGIQWASKFSGDAIDSSVYEIQRSFLSMPNAPYVPASKDPRFRAFLSTISTLPVSNSQETNTNTTEFDPSFSSSSFRYYATSSSIIPVMISLYLHLGRHRDTRCREAFAYKHSSDLAKYHTLPQGFHLVYDQESDSYFIDPLVKQPLADNVLSQLGIFLEKKFVMGIGEFDQYQSRLVSDFLAPPPLQQQQKHPSSEILKNNSSFSSSTSSSLMAALEEDSESYHFSQHGKIIIRSQLDCYCPHLKTVFDIKTRAIARIRYNISNYEEVSKSCGLVDEYQASLELYDLIRTAFIKYALQCRIGDMGGVFLAYHNTKTIHGFQYFSLEEIDRYVYGSPEIADFSFMSSFGILGDVLDCLTALPKFKKKSLALFFEPAKYPTPHLVIGAIPLKDEEDSSHLTIADSKGSYFELVTEINGAPYGSLSHFFKDEMSMKNDRANLISKEKKNTSRDVSISLKELKSFDYMTHQWKQAAAKANVRHIESQPSAQLTSSSYEKVTSSSAAKFFPYFSSTSKNTTSSRTVINGKSKPTTTATTITSTTTSSAEKEKKTTKSNFTSILDSIIQGSPASSKSLAFPNK